MVTIEMSSLSEIHLLAAILANVRMITAVLNGLRTIFISACIHVHQDQFLVLPFRRRFNDEVRMCTVSRFLPPVRKFLARVSLRGDVSLKCARIVRPAGGIRTKG